MAKKAGRPKKKATKKKIKKEENEPKDIKGSIIIDEKCGCDEPPEYEIVDWESKLEEGEVETDDKGNQFIPIKALERLSRLKGWKRQCPTTTDIKVINDNIVVFMRYEIEWNDGTISAGCADAHKGNVDGDFALYLTAIAETRAKARALRSGLGISICSKEEIATDKTVENLDDLKNASQAQIKLINKILDENDMTFYGVKEQFPDQFKNIDAPEDLTQSQATGVIGWLQKSKQRKPFKKNK